jgi:hypothetical protein
MRIAFSEAYPDARYLSTVGAITFDSVSDPRYPIGAFVRPESLNPGQRRAAVDQIRAAPSHLRAALQGLDDPKLDTPYRPGGWTVRQVTHHLPDSHLNAYIRLKLALTEDSPTVKTYDEVAWSGLADSRLPAEISVRLLEAVHARWVPLLESLDDSAWQRSFVHPDSGRNRLDQLVALYAWHGRHHVAHITSLRERMGW